MARARRTLSGARPRAILRAVRAERGLRRAGHTTRRRRRAGRDPAGLRRGAGANVLELRDEPFAADILAELEARLATPEDGAVVGFIGRTRATPGTPAPGQEAEAARTRVAPSNRSNTRRTNRWRSVF